jgi:hypothetical protein
LLLRRERNETVKREVEGEEREWRSGVADPWLKLETPLLKFNFRIFFFLSIEPETLLLKFQFQEGSLLFFMLYFFCF